MPNSVAVRHSTSSRIDIRPLKYLDHLKRLILVRLSSCERVEFWNSLIVILDA
jgi:hypothetical protein